ncbi:hypothetical protein ACHEXK_11000 [Limnohabitans sp. DCL3]|jgi:hypothetical protein|uniref:hypothetical protein n=1 Tax=Limnohabitans sp. DCL3 TaxID=3374103 RepID=UPI003A8A1FA1
MTRLLQNALQKSTLIAISAVLFVGFFQFNSWIFASLEYSHGISWVFLPAGFRVILVLVLGTSGAFGLMLGSWYIDRDMFGGSSEMLAIMNGVVSGFTPWLILKYMTSQNGLNHQLQALSTRQLLNMTLIFSAASAISHQLLWSVMERPNVNPWVDVWPMFFGNVTGALLMLYSFKFLLDRTHIKN